MGGLLLPPGGHAFEAGGVDEVEGADFLAGDEDGERFGVVEPFEAGIEVEVGARGDDQGIAADELGLVEPAVGPHFELGEARVLEM